MFIHVRKMHYFLINIITVIILGISNIVFAYNYPHQPVKNNSPFINAFHSLIRPSTILTETRFQLNGYDTQQIIVSPDGKTAYISEPNSFDSLQVEVFDLVANKTKAVIQLPEQIGASYLKYKNMVLTADGKTLYVVEQTLGEIAVIDTVTNTIVSQIQIVPTGQLTITQAMLPRISPDGSYLYVSVPASTNSSAEIAVIDTANNQIIKNIPISNTGDCNGFAITPNGNKLYVSYNNFFSSFLYVIDLSSYQVIKTIETDVIAKPNPYTSTWPALVMSHSGKNLYVMLAGCSTRDCYPTNLGILTINTSTDVITNTFLGITSSVENYSDEAISSSDDVLYINSYSNQNVIVLAINLINGKIIATLPVNSALDSMNIALSLNGNSAYMTGATSFQNTLASFWVIPIK